MVGSGTEQLGARTTRNHDHVLTTATMSFSLCSLFSATSLTLSGFLHSLMLVLTRL